MYSKGNPAVDRAVIGGDRRQDRRYHLRMELAWKLIWRRRVLDRGVGHTIDLSGGGILFEAGRSLPTGHDVELSISWPVLLSDALPMQLVAKGRIVRNECGQVAIQTVQREFLAVATSVNIQTITPKARIPNPAHTNAHDENVCSLKYRAVGTVLTHDEPLDFCAVLADHRNARFSELLTALRTSRVECSSHLDAIAFGEPRTRPGTGVIREVVEPRFIIHS